MSEIVTTPSRRPALQPNRFGGRRSYLQEGLINAFDLLLNWIERSRTRYHLNQLPDYMLNDIGISRADVEAEWEKPFWKS